jgi:transcriptional regulator with XRE-family HTH domain
MGSMAWADRIGKRARRLRKLRGEKLETTAKRAKLGIGALSDIENGKREARLDSYERLAKALGVPLGDLLGVTPRRSAPVDHQHVSKGS